MLGTSKTRLVCLAVYNMEVGVPEDTRYKIQYSRVEYSSEAIVLEIVKKRILGLVYCI